MEFGREDRFVKSSGMSPGGVGADFRILFELGP